MLNPDLYYALRDIFGPLAIKNENEKAEYDYNEMDDKSIIIKGRPKVSATVTQWGECYMVNCPMCNDQKQRLVFGHMLGQTLRRSGADIHFSKYLYKCHNEGCNVSSAMVDLDNEAFKGEMKPTKTKTKIIGLPAETALPEGSVALSHAPFYVHEYLQERGCDLEQLQTIYRIMFAPAGSVYQVANEETGDEAKEFFEDRIIIPIVNKRRMISWQARVIGETKTKKQPKYLFPKMFPKRTAIYGIDEAWKYHTVILEEGVTDTWPYGPDAMGLFGKNISSEQIKYLEIMFRHQGRCCVVLDSAKEDPTTDECSKKIVEKLTKSLAFPDGVTELRLADKDPGHIDTDQKWLREQVEASFEKT